MAGLKLVTAPTVPAVTVADLKSYLRITSTSDDAMLLTMIYGAINYFEKVTSRRLITQTWDYYLDSLPQQRFNDAMFHGGDYAEGKLSEYLSTQKKIEIPLFPLLDVTQINTYADDDVAL